MNCSVNGNEIKVKSDFSFMQTRRTNKNHTNEYIVESYIYTDKPLNEYEKEKISDWVTNIINK